MEVELKGNGLKTFTNHLRSLVDISTMITIDVRHDKWRMSSISANLAAYCQMTLEREVFSSWNVLNPTVLRQSARRINGQIMLDALKNRTIDPLEKCLITITSQLVILRVVTKGSRERLYRLRVEETEWVNVESGQVAFEFSTAACSSWITTINALPASDTITLTMYQEGCRLQASKGGLHSTAFIPAEDWNLSEDLNFTLLRADWLTAWKLAESEALLMQWRVGFPSHMIVRGAGTKADFILSCIQETVSAEPDDAEADEVEVTGTPDLSSEY